MRIKAAVQNSVSKRLFSLRRRDKKRRQAEAHRRARGEPHKVEYFHDVSDPYASLMVQLLPEFIRRYDVQLVCHCVPPPPDWAAPDRNRLEAYSRRDASVLAQRLGLQFNDPGQQPAHAAIASANADLLAAQDVEEFLQRAIEVGEKVWTQTSVEMTASRPDLEDKLKQAAQHRETLGHYLGGTLYYAGEWYWGPDRLHYLEDRLQSLDAMTSDQAPTFLFAPPIAPSGQHASVSEVRPELHWYLSFRSPYTAIVRDRIKALADAYGAELKLRYVLPMVMRGLQVPRMKGFYIMADTVREADRLNVSFGNSVDPVGAPVERGYAILHEAIRRDRGYEFVHAFLAGAWADGIDAGSDAGLKKITERAGLPWAEMKPLLGGDHWRAEAEANQQEMFKYDIWGVPSFRVGDVAAWGQDRLWLIEDALKSAAADTGDK